MPFWLVVGLCLCSPLVWTASVAETPHQIDKSVTLAEQAGNACANNSEPVECMVRKLSSVLQPRDPVPFEDWPGNRMAVEANFVAGLFVGCIEAILIYSFFPQLISYSPTSRKSYQYQTTIATDSCSWGIVIWQLLLFLAGVAGWFYYLTIVAFFWNFQSWLFLVAGVGLTVPPVLYLGAQDRAAGLNAKTSKLRGKLRLLIAGVLLGVICLAAYPNVPRMYSTEIYRRSYMNRDHSVILPHSELVTQYKMEFLGNHTAFLKWDDFHKQMDAVDVWVYKTIKWAEDYKRWKMLGTLLSADEVLTYHEGDCEGQAVTTSSLLIALGFEAWVVETPFHWWTHARHPITGEEHNLNVHGNSRQYGSVLPQPIDLVFTRPPDSSNVHLHGTYYTAPPLRALMTAWTGAHELVRDFLPHLTTQKLLAYALVLSIVSVLFTFLLAEPTQPTQGIGPVLCHFLIIMLQKLLFSFVASFIMMEVWYVWIVVYYPISLMHLLFCVPALLLKLVSLKDPTTELRDDISTTRTRDNSLMEKEHVDHLAGHMFEEGSSPVSGPSGYYDCQPEFGNMKI
eukprot:TRINITY_DN12168_c0_g1_i1.p1 TRINITY_DN12168_c0_g1~~TRINITY_DN12168_c0_g1_i1.p1  ORF type:complete len:575 (-),score=40.97 TRINITY_DN12168_c0_g1_i1:82-1779(-)